jgi:hypothetical protein
MAVGTYVSQKPAASITADDGHITFVRQGGMLSTKLHGVTSRKTVSFSHSELTISDNYV